ncbi:hypothetical protein [Ectobacillus polymachus]|uniref:hypothetical protein n=1 Tax=Ectobacillus polymachus TaxID=1508806 RepID=UPI003A879941
MLTFQEKLAIIASFPELKRKDVSLGRINFHYEESTSDKKNVVYHLHPNGNGFVYAEHLQGFVTNDKGFVNIRDFSEDDLRSILERSIRGLSKSIETEATIQEEEEWINEDGHTLILMQEDDMWNVYAGTLLDGTFHSYNQALGYLDEEGFTRRS